MANLKTLKDHFTLNKRDAAGFILMLVSLPVGDTFNSTIGVITKVGPSDFNISVKDSTIETLADLWSHDDSSDPRDNIF